MDTTMRIVLGVVCGLLLIGYLAWRWKRAGDYVAAEEARKDASRAYFEAIQRDPRWHALLGHIQQRYAISFDFHGADPATFVVQYIGLVDDQGFMYRIDNPVGPNRVVALLARKQPKTQVYLSMHLQTGELREDPAPYGWTYVGPPR